MNNIPKLRFKEFTDEWQETKLGDFADSISSGKSSTKSELDGDFPIFGSTGQIGMRKSFDYSGDKILVARVGANAGTTYRAFGKYSVSDNTLILELKNNLDINFAYNLIRKSNLKKLVFGSGQPLVTGGHLKIIKIFIPQIQEQVKIAGFLTAVDEKINKLEEKKKGFEKYKKGLMQAIFSQKIRFKKPDGSNYPDWEEEELGSVLVKNSKKNKDKKIILVQSVSNTMGFVNQVDYFERIIASKDLSNYYIIEKGTFAYNPSRIDVGSLAYKCDDRISVISPLYISFRPKPESINDGYLLSWFSSGEFLKQMNNMFEGSVRHTLNYDALKQMVINLPSPHEQEKIAGFLISLVNKVDLTYKQLEQAKLFKKSLLQQMFV